MITILEKVIIFLFNPTGFIALMLLVLFFQHLVIKSIVKDKHNKKLLEFILYIKNDKSKNGFLALLRLSILNIIKKVYKNDGREFSFIVSHKYVSNEYGKIEDPKT